MKNLNLALNSISNLKITKHFRTTMALLGMTGVLSLTGCNTDIGYETSAINKTSKETVMNVEIPEETITEEVEETKEETVEEEVIEEVKEETLLDSIKIENTKPTTLAKLLEQNGYEYSYGFRKELAKELGIENYRGTAEQNMLIYNILTGKVESPKESSTEKESQKTNETNKGNTQNQENVSTKEDQKEESSNNQERPSSGNQGNSNQGSTTNPGTEPGKPGTNPEEPGTNPEEPGTNPEEPGTDPEKPGTDPEKPGTDPEKPGTDPEKPGTDPEKPGTDPEEPDKEHTIHNWSEWYSTNDGFEERVCANGGEKERRNCKYEVVSSTTTPAGQTTHTTTTVEECVNCHHQKTTSKTEDCTFTNPKVSDDKQFAVSNCNSCTNTLTEPHTHTPSSKVTRFDKDHEYFACPAEGCGVEKVGNHNMDSGVLSDDGTHITYSCVNTETGCTFSYTEEVEHNHVWEEFDSRPAQQENLCRYIDEKCTLCSETRTIEDTTHNFVVTDNSDRDVDIIKCTDCGYRTETYEKGKYPLASDTIAYLNSFQSVLDDMSKDKDIVLRLSL